MRLTLIGNGIRAVDGSCLDGDSGRDELTDRKETP
jgi:hypothetical protein